MRYKFINAKILSNEEIIEGEVCVEDQNIVYVGANASNFEADRVIDVKGNLLMSGLVNCHAHTPSTVLRGIADDLSLQDFLNTIVPYEQALTDEDIYWSVMLGIAEYVRGGITAVEENYSRIEPIVKAYKTAGFRARISIGYPNFMETREQDLEYQYDLVKNSGFNAVCYAHSLYGTDEKFFDDLVYFAGKNNLPTSLHLSETLKEVGDINVKYDKSPAQLLEEYGYLDRGCSCYHCVHCDKEDIEILNQYQANVITCPSSNLKLASGIAPLYAFQNAGLNVAIGTDGAYSNNTYDMFKEMFLVATLNKGILYMPDILKAKDVIKMATQNGGKVLGYKIGDIKQGYLADIILLDINNPHFQPNNNLISNIVYSAKSSDVYLTMINGKIVYENGKYDIGEDINTIYKKNIEIKNRIIKKEN